MLSITVVSVASLIVLAAIVVFGIALGIRRTGAQQNFAPPANQPVTSASGRLVLSSQSSGSSSFLFVEDTVTGTSKRLTNASSGIESEASFSHDGKLVVFSSANGETSRSTVWIIGVDGSNPHAVSAANQDALHPVFGIDDKTVVYGVSSYTGKHSPIVRPARHNWDVFSIPVQVGGPIAGAVPTQITHAALYDMQSLDISPDGISPDTAKILISTSGYPIGSLLEEFGPVGAGRDKIFQPHVPGESSAGPSYGEARYIHGGMDILFLAATDTSDGNYDYNIYSMSDVTGGEIKQLTHVKGQTSNLKVLPNGKATFVNGGTVYLLDIEKQTVSPL
jgi:Tol biopolymer transport system component